MNGVNRYFCPKCHKLAAEVVRTEEKVELRQNGKVLVSLGAGSKGNKIGVRCEAGHNVAVEI